jgi:hypothetical protein
MALEPWKEVNFPNLSRTEYQVISDETPEYNCIAWAAGDSSRWWWPSQVSYWPAEAPLEATIESFRAVFELMGYEECATEELESGFEKVAFYIDADGSPTHAARQLEDGIWTSKLGSWQDIEHNALRCLGGAGWAYGVVALILRRPRRGSS